MKKLFLLDGMALIFRAHFALIRNPRINSKGVNTSAPMGFVNSLLEILKKQNPTHIGVSFDLSGPTFRHEMYKEYKANRQETPEDISIAIPIVKKIVDAFNIPRLEVEGYEADDVIGTLAKEASKQGFQTFMMTPDKDYAQLVDENTFLYRPSTKGGIEILGEKEVLEKFDLDRIDQVIDLLGLQGDAVDNIPGIPGVGPKTAVKLLKQYSTVEGILEHSSELKGKLKERVEGNKEQAILSKELATIKIDVPIAFEEDKLLVQEPNKEEIIKIFNDLEFKTLLGRLFPDAKPAPTKKVVKAGEQASLFGAPTSSASKVETVEEVVEEEELQGPDTIGSLDKNYRMIDSEERYAELINYLSKQKEFAFDTETSSLDALEAQIVGMSFSAQKDEAYYVPVPLEKEEADKVLAHFQPLFENKEILKIGQNLKYDLQVMDTAGVKVQGPFFDTMLAHYLIEPDKRHGMDSLSETYLNYIPVSIETVLGKKGKKQKNMKDLPASEIYEYACEDADVTLQLKEKFLPILEEKGLKELFENLEMPLLETLKDMEKEGVNLDVPSLELYSIQIGKEVEQLEKDIYALAGEEFTISSPKQLGVILFEKMKLVDKPKKTKTGQYATGEEILQGLKQHEIVEKILDFRQLAKLKSTYVDALPKLIKADGRVHTTYNQAVAATGRLSSTDPNLQNIPIKTSRGREIRKAFVARDENYTFVAADYSQVELRIMAAFSKDEEMLNAFKDGRDIHTATAAKVFKVDEKDVEPEMRRRAKTANFGIIYGVSAFGLSQQLNIARSEAKELIDNYFVEFPAIKKYMDDVIAKARDNEYVETLMGRRRYLRDINSRNFTVRGMAERNAINAPIQGTAADIIKKAMIEIQEWMNAQDLKSKMILQVHDELIFDVHNDELELMTSKIKEMMENAYDIGVPLEVEVGKGINWLEAH
ncbi:DNA polymerase I [Flammeovirga sp. EKP202]|uniref:DNA polymerase I n=1 Tax=Flammeovirga sp. EKP202 TaxID=2770592 RepID=UPI00165F8942|nr:DNA polymerase I [Flammeovirga sp. EKP202]MBD0402666.1 DNA polymerase I [Flammeovirga sp. EKP202]